MFDQKIKPFNPMLNGIIKETIKRVVFDGWVNGKRELRSNLMDLISLGTGQTYTDKTGLFRHRIIFEGKVDIAYYEKQILELRTILHTATLAMRKSNTTLRHLDLSAKSDQQYREILTSYVNTLASAIKEKYLFAVGETLIKGKKASTWQMESSNVRVLNGTSLSEIANFKVNRLTGSLENFTVID
jgi:hypothetical protein